MVRTRLPREPEERKGSKDVGGRGGKKRRGHVGSVDPRERLGVPRRRGKRDDEGLEGLGVPLNSVGEGGGHGLSRIDME